MCIRDRTIRMEMKEYGLPEPEFKNGRNEFIVVLYNKEVEENVALTLEEKILEFCKEPRSRKEIAKFLEIKTPVYAYSKYILPLIKEGRIAMTIPDIPTSRNQRYYKIK